MTSLSFQHKHHSRSEHARTEKKPNLYYVGWIRCQPLQSQSLLCQLPSLLHSQISSLSLSEAFHVAHLVWLCHALMSQYVSVWFKWTSNSWQQQSSEHDTSAQQLWHTETKLKMSKAFPSSKMSYLLQHKDKHIFWCFCSQCLHSTSVMQPLKQEHSVHCAVYCM